MKMTMMKMTIRMKLVGAFAIVLLSSGLAVALALASYNRARWFWRSG